MSLNLSIPKSDINLAPRITVIGVGGAGGNAVSNMIQSDLEGVEFIIANTDAQALGMSMCERRIQMGANITQGLGAGSRPDIGRAAAEETLDEILAELDGTNMVFITAGMGGGSGTGGAPVIARAAREAGILTIGVVTKPFQFEGVHRMRMAEAGITEMTQYVDTLIVIPNQNLFRVANEKTTFADAFKMADDVLRSGVRGVTDLMVMPGLINLDFADIRSVMTEMGKAMMGTGEAEGDNRALAAAEAAISNPLLDEVSMKGARGVLINITGGMDLTLFEVDEAANRIRDEVDPEANIIFGSTFEPSLDGRMRVSVVATGIDADAATAPRPLSLSLVSDQGERPLAEQTADTAGGGGTAARAAPARDARAAPSMDTAFGETAVAGQAEPLPAARGTANRLYSHAQAAAVAENLPLAEEAEAEALPEETSAEVEAGVTAALPEAAFVAPAPTPDPFSATPFDDGCRAPHQEAETGDERGSGFDRKKAQRLFARMTGGAARAFTSATQGGEQRDPARTEPSLLDDVNTTAESAQGVAPHPAADLSTPAPSAQPPLSGLESTARPGDARDEEDFLDIPAFLRRQAN